MCDVYDDFEAISFQPSIGVLKHFQFVTAADTLRCLLVNGLQAQLDPDGFAVFFSQPAQHCDHFRRQAVRAGSQIKRDDQRVFQSFGVDAAQAFRVAVSVGVGLEVGDVAAVFRCYGWRYFGVYALSCRSELLVNGQKRRGKITRAALRAEGAAAGAQCAVAIRAGAAALQGQPVYFGAEAGAHGVVRGKIVHNSIPCDIIAEE